MMTSATHTRLAARAHGRPSHPAGVEPFLVLLRIVYTLALVLAFAVAVGAVLGYGLTFALAQLVDVF